MGHDSSLQKRLTEVENELASARLKIVELETKLQAIMAGENTAAGEAEFLRQSAQRLKGLYALDRTILEADSLENLGQLALDHLVQLIPCTRASISTLNLTTKTAYVLALYSEQETVVAAHQSYPLTNSYFEEITDEPYLVMNQLDQHPLASVRRVYDAGIRTILLIPLRVEGSLVGLVNLHAMQTDYFTEEIIQIAVEVGNQIATGIHKAMLADTVARHTQRLEGMRALDRAILEADSLENMAELALDHVIRLVPCARVSISTLNLTTRTAYMLALYSQYETIIPARQNYPVSDLYYTAITTEPYTILKNLDQGPSTGVQQLFQEGIRTILMVPLRAEGKIVGLLNLHAVQTDYFTGDAIQVALEVGNQIAIGIHNRLLSDALALHAQRLEGLHALDRAILEADSLENMAELALDHVVRLIPCARASISTVNLTAKTNYLLALYSEIETEITPRQTYPLSNYNFTPLLTEPYVIIKNLDQDPLERGRRLFNAGIRSSVLVPLRVQGKLMGLLNLNARQTDYFTEDKLQIAVEVGNQIAIGIHKTMLADSVARHTRRLEGLHALDRAILAADSLENLAQLALNHAIELIPCFRASLSTVNLSAKTLYVLAMHTESDSTFAAHQTYPINEIYLSAITLSRSVILSDLDHSPDRTVRELFKEGIRTILLIPLRVEGNLIGLFNFHAVQTGYFTEDTVQIAIEVGNQIAISIHKAALTDQLTRYARRMEILHAIDLGLIHRGSIKELAGSTLNQLKRLIPCERIGIGILQPSMQEVVIFTSHFDYLSELNEGTRLPVPPGWFDGFGSDGIRVIHDLQGLDRPVYRQLFKEGFRSHLQVLLRAENSNMGVMGFSSTQLNFFTSEHEEVAIEVANQLTIALNQVRLTEKLARYAQRMEILHAIDLGLIQGGSIKTLISRTFQQLKRLIPCERIGIKLLQPSTQEVVVFSSHFDYTSELNEGDLIPVPPDWLDGFNAEGVRIVEKLHTHPDPVYQILAREGFHSQLQVLLQSESQDIGVVAFSSTQVNFFTPEYQETAVEVSNQLAIALNQVRLSEALKQYMTELEQRVAERTAELQTSKDQIETILQNSLDGILLIDRDLRIQQANPAVSRLLSVELEENQTVNLLDVIHADHASRIRQSIERALMEQITPPVEVQTWSRDGTRVDMEFTFGSIPGDGLVSTIHDITARKQAEEVLRLALEQERELVEAKSRFVSVTSHEFRTPLAVILSASDTLLAYRDRLSPAQIDQKLDAIRENVRHMTSIMDDVLELAKLQSGTFDFRPRFEDMDALCLKIMEQFENYPGAQGRLIYTGSGTPIKFMFDPRLMRLAIGNLVSNALKYSPAGKSVEVTLRQDTGTLSLEVRDQGIGVPVEDRARLFEPFHRAGNVGNIQGTGLGLSITRQIVERHRGQIQVESQTGLGSTFTIVLPLELPLTD